MPKLALYKSISTHGLYRVCSVVGMPTGQVERRGQGQEGRGVKSKIADTINSCLFNLFKVDFRPRVSWATVQNPNSA